MYTQQTARPNPSFSTYQLCDFEKVAYTLYASIVKMELTIVSASWAS